MELGALGILVAYEKDASSCAILIVFYAKENKILFVLWLKYTMMVLLDQMRLCLQGTLWSEMSVDSLNWASEYFKVQKMCK